MMHMPTRPTHVRWLIVGLLVILVFLAHFNRVCISVPGGERFITDDGMTEVEMGRIYSAFLLVYTIGMLPGGWLIDRLGPRWAMAAMGIGFGFCTILTGMLGLAGLTIAALYLPLMCIRGIAGASSVPLHPGAARSVSLWLPAARRSTANGLITAGALVGIALTFPGFGWLMDRVDWPAAFMITGGALMFFGVLWYLLSADSPAMHPWSNDAEQELVTRGETVATRTTASFADIARLFGNRSLILVTFSYGALGYVQYLFFYWISYYLEKEMKLPKSESRDASFIITMSMAVGMACGGWLSDLICRLFGQNVGSRGMVIAGMGLCAMFALFGARAHDPQMIVAMFSLSLGALGLCEGVFWTTTPNLAKSNGGLAAAVMNTGGNGVGMLAPVVTPLIARAFDWSAAIVVACIVCAIGGALWFGVRVPAADSSDASAPSRQSD